MRPSGFNATNFPDAFTGGFGQTLGLFLSGQHLRPPEYVCCHPFFLFLFFFFFFFVSPHHRQRKLGRNVVKVSDRQGGAFGSTPLVGAPEWGGAYEKQSPNPLVQPPHEHPTMVTAFCTV